jgi:hypothetical protein
VKHDIDLRGLEMTARASIDGEGYLVISKGDGFRIGLVVRILEDGIIDHTLELLVRFLDRGHTVNTERMEQALRITRALTERSYELNNENDGWIYAERQIDPVHLGEEIGFLKEQVEGFDEVNTPLTRKQV